MVCEKRTWLAKKGNMDGRDSTAENHVDKWTRRVQRAKHGQVRGWVASRLSYIANFRMRGTNLKAAAASMEKSLTWGSGSKRIALGVMVPADTY